MKGFSPLLLIFLGQLASDAEVIGIEALLAFRNGDQLHGRYLGYAENRLSWQRDDLAHHAEFEMSKLRRVILRNGRTDHPLSRGSHAATVHGDRIPGRIVSMDDTKLVLESDLAGRLEIPRDHLGMLAPTPYGRGIRYQGPFAEDDWRQAEIAGGISGDGDEAPDQEANQGWVHAGAAWYWPADARAQALFFKGEIPASTVIRCHVSWKSRMSLALAFHADFKSPAQPEVADDEPAPPRRRIHMSDTNIYSELYGNSYILQINPTHALLYRSVVDEAGASRVDRMHTAFNNINLGESGTADVEIRASRTTGEIALFINDEFVAQWSEIGDVDGAGGPAHTYAGLGGGMGFLVQSHNAAVRISDIVVSEWNGMPDAARSMQSDDHDIVLLTNGTDRFSGKIESIKEGRVSISARYGAFDVPVDDVAEIRFATNGLAKTEAPATGSIRLHSHPVGMLTGVPISGDGSHIRIEHPSCGTIDVSLTPMVMIEMQLAQSFLDAWDPDR